MSIRRFLVSISTSTSLVEQNNLFLEKIDTIRALTKSGEIRINCLDKDGMTPLDQACFKGNQELVEFFIENGADVDNRAHQQGYTALMFAALAGSQVMGFYRYFGIKSNYEQNQT